MGYPKQRGFDLTGEFQPHYNSDPDSKSINWGGLGSDLTALILSYLPIRSIVRASVVCKLWQSVVSEDNFTSRVSAMKKPWFFLYGQNNVFLKKNQAYGFDPEANEWIQLPSTLFPKPCEEDSFMGSGGFFFTTTSTSCSKFCYTHVLKGSWRETPPLRFPRCNPLVGVIKNGGFKFIVVGGVSFIGGLVDIEDRLDVEIYDSHSDSWELCPPLPVDLQSANSSQWLSSALLKGKFYVFGIYSCFVSSFDLDHHLWSEVQTLRPPGILFSFLLACCDRLILAGLCNITHRPSFNLWRVDEQTMEYTLIAVMPQDLLYCLIDSDEDDKFASLKCVGLGSLIYVFNEEYHKAYPACVCEISADSKCVWRKVPALPSPVNQFHKVISFCSNVSLDSILSGNGS